MANINLTPGERYTFGKLKGVSVITDSTDNAESAKYIRNSLYVTSSAPTIFVKGGGTANNALTQIETEGSGDPALRLSVGTTAAENWIIGIDNSDSDTFKIQNGTTLGSAVTLALSIDINENVSIPKNLYVTGSTIISGSTIPINTAWTSYTPIWTAASVNPSIGNGTLEGWYKVIGKTCFVRGNIVMGSTTTFGTGEWYVSMPFTASHADAILMTANLLDNGSAWYNATLNGARAGFNFKTAIQYQSTGGTALDVRSNQPFTWANSDRFIWNGSFELA